MKRDRITFAEFKDNFIKQPDGYFPVYSSFEEDYEGNNLRLLTMDMICEWRLDDGKIKFVEVPFDTEEQFNELVAYLRTTADLLNKAILERIGELDYTITKPESERIPYPPSSIPKLTDEENESIKKKVFQYEMSLFYQALQKMDRHEIEDV